MQRRFVLFALASAALFVLPQSAYAQEAQPGDACTTNGAVRSTGGPEQMPRRMLICNGTTWQSALEQTTAGASLLQIGNDTGSCTTAKLGRMRYDGTSTWEYCNGSTWTALGGGSTSAAGADRDIQFNSNGSFAASSTYKLMADGDILLTGTHTGTASAPASGAGTRMFFDTQMSAFRAGAVAGTQWNSGSIGQYSAGFGLSATASGDYALAMGLNTTASGDFDVAMGEGSAASGGASLATGTSTQATAWASTALGEATRATGDNALASGLYTLASNDVSTAMGGFSEASGYASLAVGEQVLASGDYSMAFGRTTMAGDGVRSGTAPFAATNPSTGENAVSFGLGAVFTQSAWPRTTGNSSFGIFMGGQSNVTLSASNTMGLFGGKMVIDPAIPATNLSADTALEIAGTLKIGSGGEACDAAREGSIRYLAASDTFEACATAGSWTALGGGGAALSDLTAATATNTIANANFTQNWNWDTLTTGNGLSLGSSSLTTGNVLYAAATNTAASGSAIYATTNSTTNNAAAVEGVATGASGRTYGLYGTTNSAATGAAGIFAWAYGASAATYGGNFGTDSTSGIGISAQATATTGSTMGGFFRTDSTGSAYGVYGEASAGTGPTMGGYFDSASTSGTGVYGNASASSGTTYGLYGRSASTSGYGGYFTNTHASGGWGLYSTDDIGLAANMYLNWGTTRGSGGYGIRDNAGTIECKNSGGAWAACAGGGGSAAGADREIQFNSGGAFGASSTYKLMADGDLLLTGTHTGTASVPVTGAGTRMFFDIQQGAFRAGEVTGTQWDNANVGTFSVAMGKDTEASGQFSLAIGETSVASNYYAIATGLENLASGQASFAGGWYSIASGDTAIAFGDSTYATGAMAVALGDTSMALADRAIAIGGGGSRATGSNSIALGNRVYAGDGVAVGGDPANGSQNPGTGEGAMAIGLVTSLNAPSPRPMVTGDQSLGIFMGNQSGVNLTTANQMNLMGGKMVIDSTVPATNLVADTELEIDGTLKIGSGGEACDASREGSIRYLAASDTFETCATAGSWTALGGGSASAAGADREIQFNSGGTFGASSTFKLMADGDLLLTGTYTGTASVPVSGAGSRMFLDTQKMALRIGTASGTEWDNANIGNYSFAFGEATTASAYGSIALGGSSSASGVLSLAHGDTSSAEGPGSIALGNYTHATGSASIALGNSIYATGDYTFAAGDANTASGYAAVALGGSNTASGVGSLALGMESSATGSHSIALGHYVKAGNGLFNSGDPTLGSADGTVGEASMAIGLITSANNPTTYPTITGDQSLGIMMGNQDGVVLSSANTMGLFGGKMVIDSTVPATNLVADTELEIDGTLKIGSGGESCDAAREGSIQYLAASDTFQVCATAGSWSAMGGGASLSGLTAATAANTINNANFAQTWQWNSLTTGTGLALSSSSVTSGRILSVVSSGTSASGPAIYAESNANSSSGHGIRSSVNSSTGGSYAMYGSTFGPGAGVFGEATNTAVTGSRGVYGLSTGINGIGMLGQATSTTGTGVYGHAMGSSGTTYGVYGTSASSAGYGGYFTNTSTGVALHAAGDIEYTGVLRDMSDIRLKDNVTPLESSLEKITQLQGISFTMKDSTAHDTEYGFSAQEVQKIYPDLVHKANDEDGTLSMNYTGLIAPLVEAIKEQQKEIEALRAEIETLKSATQESGKTE